MQLTKIINFKTFQYIYMKLKKAFKQIHCTQLNICAAHLCHLICTNFLQKMHFFNAFWDKFALYLVPYYDAFQDKFSEQHQHQSRKKAPYLMPKQHFFGENKVALFYPLTSFIYVIYMHAISCMLKKGVQKCC